MKQVFEAMTELVFYPYFCVLFLRILWEESREAEE